MKTGALKVYLEQLAVMLEKETLGEQNVDRVCELLDAQEYLRRAWHALDGSPTEDNQTTREMSRAMRGDPTTESNPRS